MGRKRISNFIFIFLLILIFLVGCTNQSLTNNQRVTYNYGVIYTSNIENISSILLYTDDWKEVKKIDLKVGGLQQITQFGDNIYIPVLGIPNKPDHRILVFNTKNESIHYINTKSFPLKATVSGNYLYVIHNTRMNEGMITKINLTNNQIINSLSLQSVPREIIATEENVFVISDNPAIKKQTIYQLDKNLTKLAAIVNPYTAYPTDVMNINNKLLIMNVAKNDFSGPIDKYTELDLKNNEITLVSLKSLAPHKIFKVNDKLIISHYDPPANTGNEVSVIDVQGENEKIYDLKNTLYRTKINSSKLISINNSMAYEYNIKTFDFVNKYRLRNDSNKIISDFFVNNNKE